jgi:hypothetical protein
MLTGGAYPDPVRDVRRLVLSGRGALIAGLVTGLIAALIVLVLR